MQHLVISDLENFTTKWLNNKIHSMAKNIKIKSILWLTISISFFIIIACKKDKFQNYSQLNFNNNLIAPFSILRKECEGTLAIPFKLVGGTQFVDMNFEVSIIGGTATEGIDYELITQEFTLEAFKDSAAITVAIYEDDIVEVDETIIIRVKEIGPGKNFASGFVDITVNLVSSGTSTLEFEFDWANNILLDDETYNTCNEFDIDIYLYDEEDNDLGIYDGATENCPEAFSLDLSTLGATTFYLSANLYLNFLRSTYPSDNTPIPITTNISRIAGESVSFTQSNTNAFKVSSTDFENDGNDTVVKIAKVEYDGQCTVFIYNTDNDASATLRRKK